MFSFPPASAAYAPSNSNDILRALESALNDVLRTQPVRPLPALASLVEDPNLPPSSPRHSAGPHTLSDTLQKYIQKHQLSERVEQALNNVLAERPRDARRGLADALRRAPASSSRSCSRCCAARPRPGRALRCEDAPCRPAAAARRGAQAAAADGGDERPLNEGTYDPLLRAASSAATGARRSSSSCRRRSSASSRSRRATTSCSRRARRRSSGACQCSSTK